LKSNDQFLRIAIIAGAHGLKGQIKLAVVTDIYERFAPNNTLYLKIGNEYKPFLCTGFIEGGKNSIIKFENINDRDAALSLKGIEIYIDKSNAEKTRNILDSDDFYYYDLLECKVYRDEKVFGNVVDIMKIGESTILVIHDTEGKEVLIPFIESMVNTKHISDGRIDINPIDGLLD
jgi:16S rRNA processing protein RimM